MSLPTAERAQREAEARASAEEAARRAAELAAVEVRRRFRMAVRGRRSRSAFAVTVLIFQRARASEGRAREVLANLEVREALRATGEHRHLTALAHAARAVRTFPQLTVARGLAIDALPKLPVLHHDGPVQRAAFSADGTRVVTASSDNTARVWDGSPK